MSHTLPNQNAPALEVETLAGKTWRLGDQKRERFTMIVFYRGLHCPVCAKYVAELDRLLDQFADRGVGVLAVSCDPLDRARKAHDEWGIEHLEIGYGLSIETARSWGLYISKAVSEKETPQFCEPGLFLVRPDGTLYYVAINSMPFGRPKLEEMVGGIDFVIKKDYPARGEA
ncbi:MAG: peroxiredoxin-like family protein [Rhodanobacteraceae bacterium]